MAVNPLRALLSLLTASVLVLPTACADRPDDAFRTAPSETPVHGGTLVIAAPTGLDHANPLVSQQAYTGEVLRYLLFMPLIRYDEELEFEPYLAESWQMLGDTGVVFHLREDVYWHDGVRTTAYDVAFTFRRAKNPETAYPDSDDFAHWTGVEVIDSFTVRFSFEPHLRPLAALPFFPIVPRHLLEDVPPAEMRRAEFNDAPVGNGPFRFVSQRQDDRWIFAANPDFPEELGGRPYLDRVVWRVVPESSTQIVNVLTGAADMALSPRADRIEATGELRVFTRPTRRYLFVGWNGRREPFGDPRVRRALALAMDRRTILDVLRSGYGTLAVGPIPPWHWAYNDRLEPLPYAPERARRLLAEAGFRNRDDDEILEHRSGRELAFTLKIPAQNDYNRDVALLLQSDLARVGARMEIRAIEYTTLVGQITSPERAFDAVLMGLQTDIRVKLHDLFHSEALGGPFQLASYSDRRVDELLDRLARATTRAEARPLFYRLQEILRREQPWTFLYYSPAIGLYRERVRGVEMDIRGLLTTITQWWLADAGGKRVAKGVQRTGAD